MRTRKRKMRTTRRPHRLLLRAIAFHRDRADLGLVFASREEAGLSLGRWLRDRQLDVDLVIGLPRGGVVVAAEVAHVLNLPLDVLSVRKIGHPLFREFALGALAEGEVLVLEKELADDNPGLRAQLAEVIRDEEQRLKAYQARFAHLSRAGLASKNVLLVDDGLATGATTEAAVRSALKRGARSVIVAAPVGSAQAVERLGRVADRVEVMFVDPEFEAVGQYYHSFPQTTDEEVLELLSAA